MPDIRRRRAGLFSSEAGSMPLWAISLAVYYVIVCAGMSGFLFHRKPDADLFGYSYKYLTVVLAAWISLLALPLVVRWIVIRHGAKKLAFSVTPALVVLMLVYVVVHFMFIGEKHLFDPFLQIPNPRFELETAKGEREFRVLCLGGSTTENARLPREKRYPSVLQAMLREDYPKYEVEVLNGGMGWYATRHSLINYTNYCRKFRPDVVVVMHAINDICRSFSPPRLAIGEYKDDYSHYYAASINGANPQTFESAVLRRLSEVWFHSVSETDLPMSAYRSLPSFEDYLETLLFYIKADGAECLVVEQPFIYRPDLGARERKSLWLNKQSCIDEDGVYPSPASLEKAMDLFNSRARQICSRRKVPFVETVKHFKRTAEHFVDDVHYTEVGAEILADLVRDSIVKHGLLETE
ncbi:MAG: SGNH/GDSL hydrolase family protein [Planctomycetota bacterium]|jgi:lysophospholipase L1-like esterase